jgi:hypothetical protein
VLLLDYCALEPHILPSEHVAVVGVVADLLSSRSRCLIKSVTELYDAVGYEWVGGEGATKDLSRRCFACTPRHAGLHGKWITQHFVRMHIYD